MTAFPPERVTELRNMLAEAATQGEWVRTNETGSQIVDEWVPATEPDAALIVAVVNALPELLDEIERLRRQKERWKPKLHERVAIYTDLRDIAIRRALAAEAENKRLAAGITELIEQNDECAGFHTCQRDELRVLLDGETNE